MRFPPFLDVTFCQAWSNLRARYSLTDWYMLPPSRVTAELYEEVRRLDLERGLVPVPWGRVKRKYKPRKKR